MAQDRYAKNAGAVFSLKFHLVWCPKYRRPVLSGRVDERLKELLTDVATEHGMTIHAMEVMPDHVHLLLAAVDPQFGIHRVVKAIKGRSSKPIRRCALRRSSTG